MLITAYQVSDLDLEKLACVYCDDNPWIISAFCDNAYDYFSEHIGGYALWQEDKDYVCALRFEPYRDGILLSCLQTRQDSRRKGFAQKLILSLHAHFRKPLYSHVEKKNTASRSLHSKCGFEMISDTAVLLDGTVTSRYETLCLKRL